MTDKIEVKSQEVCHLLRLSDEVVLKIFDFLSVKARLNAASLHSRIRNITEESWKHVHHFPSQKVGFRFHKDKKRTVHLEQYLSLILRCKNLVMLRIPGPARDDKFWTEAGRKIGSHCPLLRRLVGQYNDIELVVGIVSSSLSGSKLVEISVRQIRSVHDLDKLLVIANQCQELRTVRILINSIPTSILRCADVRFKLRALNSKLQSLVVPQSLSIHLSE